MMVLRISLTPPATWLWSYPQVQYLLIYFDHWYPKFAVLGVNLCSITPNGNNNPGVTFEGFRELLAGFYF